MTIAQTSKKAARAVKCLLKIKEISDIIVTIIHYSEVLIMKLCFSTLGCSEMSLDEIFSLCSDFGISAIEIRGIGGVLDNSKISAFLPESINDTKNAFTKSGIAPITLGTSCTFHNKERLDGAIKEGLEAIKIAEGLGIPYIRVFGDKLIEGDELGCTERLIKGIKTICESAKNTSVLLEVHGNYNTEAALAPVLDGLKDVENFGIIWDIEHTQDTYGENWIEFYRFIRPYLKHVHIKDRSSEGKLVLVGDGIVPIIPITKQLLSDGYDGYFSLEWEKKWHPELPDIRTALEAFVKVMNEVLA